MKIFEYMSFRPKVTNVHKDEHKITVDISDVVQGSLLHWVYIPVEQEPSIDVRISIDATWGALCQNVKTVKGKIKFWDFVDKYIKTQSPGCDMIWLGPNPRIYLMVPSECEDMLWCVKRIPVTQVEVQ